MYLLDLFASQKCKPPVRMKLQVYYCELHSTLYF